MSVDGVLRVARPCVLADRVKPSLSASWAWPGPRVPQPMRSQKPTRPWARGAGRSLSRAAFSPSLPLGPQCSPCGCRWPLRWSVPPALLGPAPSSLGEWGPPGDGGVGAPTCWRWAMAFQVLDCGTFSPQLQHVAGHPIQTQVPLLHAPMVPVQEPAPGYVTEHPCPRTPRPGPVPGRPVMQWAPYETQSWGSGLELLFLGPLFE